MRDLDIDTLAADPWFATMVAERREALLREARVELLAAGARIYGLGDPPNGLWAVLEGQVRLKVGNGWFGGFLPTAAFAMVAATGDIYYGLWYPILACAVTALVGLVFLPETFRRSLHG